jgi:riboflavin synthase
LTVVFTGLIAEVGRITAVQRSGDGMRLAVRAQLADELSDGDSVAVNGVCLTATGVGGDAFHADVMAETLARSALAGLDGGAQVNLELPLRAADRLGGHMVQGHVDGTATVTGTREEGFSRVLQLDAAADLRRYLVLKGSVALDGVSLTVSDLDERGFAVSLIPETLRRTTLGELEEGALVNVEVDILAKHLERLIEAHRDALQPSGRS